MDKKEFYISKSVYRREIIFGLIGTVVLSVVLMVIHCAGFFISDYYWYMPVSVVLVCADIIYSLIAPAVRRKYTRVDASGEGIVVFRGKVFASERAIPHRNVTMLVRSIGPIDKKWGHEHITVKASSTELELPLMPSGTALNISNILSIPLEAYANDYKK